MRPTCPKGYEHYPCHCVATRTETFSLVYDGAPKSLNNSGTGSRRHWSVGAREKREWEGIWGFLLMGAKVPRGMTKAHVDVLLEFEDNRKRDPENFRPAIAKPLADILVKGGWLADDTAEFFDFGHVKIVSGVKLDQGMALDRRTSIGRTTVTLEAEYADG